MLRQQDFERYPRRVYQWCRATADDRRRAIAAGAYCHCCLDRRAWASGIV